MSFSFLFPEIGRHNVKSQIKMNRCSFDRRIYISENTGEAPSKVQSKPPKARTLSDFFRLPK